MAIITEAATMYSGTVNSGTLPLEDVTVVDLTQVLAGPFASMAFGDMGAEVIKIEAIGRGDRSRNIQPSPAYFDMVNRNKRSVALDLKREEGQDVARRLLSEADVFIESTKPGRAEAFNLGYEDVRELNPRLIYCSVTGFGHDSPYEDVPAWDMLIQAMSGIMSMTGEADGPPVWSGLPSGDLAAATYAIQSVLAALYARERGDIDGEWIEIPMFDAAVSWLSLRAGHSFGTGEPFPRSGTRHPSIAPFGAFECADDRLVIAAGTDSLWGDLCESLDRPELHDDDRFRTLEDRLENRDALVAELESILASRSREAWIERLHAHGVPAGPIHDTRSVWEDEHVRRRQLHRRMERDGREAADVIDHPVHFANLATHLETPPEKLGESTDETLERYGYTQSEIDHLRERNVVQ
jgi:crotonobetainyl-CoA:carnitine CoA-transferase CaiB-like acyl-CoA transferase